MADRDVLDPTIKSAVVWGTDAAPVAEVKWSIYVGWDWRCIEHGMSVNGFHTAGGAIADLGHHLAEMHP